MKKIIKKILGILARGYHQIRASHFIWWRVLNREGRNLHKKYNQELSQKEREIVEKIRKEGIAILNISDLLGEEVFSPLKNFADKRWNDPDVVEKYNLRHTAVSDGKFLSKDYFLVNLWPGEKVLDLTNPFILLSVNDSILRIINAYLGTFSKFRGWHLQVTTPMPEGDRRYGSQEWHRDPEDLTLIKTFLYLNDVDKGAGPFIYLKKSQPGGKWHHLFPPEPPRGSSAKEESIPQEDMEICTGKTGTLIFCDTSGLHRGGYATTDSRFMYTSVYTTPASPWPALFKSQDKKYDLALSPQAEYALKSDPNQKEPKFYKF